MFMPPSFNTDAKSVNPATLPCTHRAQCAQCAPWGSYHGFPVRKYHLGRRLGTLLVHPTYPGTMVGYPLLYSQGDPSSGVKSAERKRPTVYDQQWNGCM